MAKSLLLATAALMSFGAIEHLPANLIIAIDHTGANNPVNVDNCRVWNFGITSKGASYFNANGLSFDSALFDAKDHNNTTAPLVFTLYSGLGGGINGNSVLASLSIPSSQFTQQYGDGSLFTFTPQFFSAGYYSVTLTSTAPDISTQDYFLKQGKLTLLDGNQTPLNSAFWLQDQGTGNASGVFGGSGSIDSADALVPEPNPFYAAILLAGLGLSTASLPRFQRKPALAVAR